MYEGGLQRKWVFCAVRQDFVFDARRYTSLCCGPVTLGNFCTFLSTAGAEETLSIIIRMQQTGGWHCALSFRRCSPSETAIPSVLAPSKYPSLKDIPSLELDLKAVEKLTAKPCIIQNDGKSFNCWNFPDDGKNATVSHNKNSVQPVPGSKLAPQAGWSMVEPVKNKNVGSVNSEIMTQLGHPIDIWQNWGSELELATPEGPPSRVSLADLDFGTSESNPMLSLDLNVDLHESSLVDDEPDCSLLLSTRAAEQQSPLELHLETPALSTQQSSVTDGSVEHSGLESFADSLSSYKNMVSMSKDRLLKLDIMNYPGAMHGENSGGYQGSVINAVPPYRNGNALLTSNLTNSSPDRNPCARIKSQVTGCPTITPRNMCFMEHYKYDAKGNGKQINLRRGGRNIDAVKSKARSVGPGGTSERITEITLQELTQYFSMPITEAATKLNVGLTVLKKRCREFQIPRWPHRKMKSINSLIGNIKDLAKEEGVKTSPRVLNVVRELEEQKKLMEEMPGVELAERTKKLRQACFKANYKKRRLSRSSNNNVHPRHDYVPEQRSSVDLNFSFSNWPPRSSLTVGHFPICSSSDAAA